MLWVRLLDSLVAQPLPGTEDAGLPFWSPDSRWIGFFAQAKLKKVDVTGGRPQILCDAPNGRGGTWNRDGIIVFNPNSTAGLSRVSSAGGEPSALTKRSGGQISHRFPFFLPDGRHFVYYATGPTSEIAGIHLGALDSSDGQRLLAADSAAIYARPGFLLFVRQGTLLAQPFDAARLQLTGDPVRLAESVPFDASAAAFSVSDNGVLTYRIGSVGQNQQLAWLDRTGKLLESLAAPGSYQGVDLSPDGKRIAVHRHDGNGGDIWVFEPRGTMTRLTFEASQDNASPIWSPDGSRIVFGSLRNGKWGLYQKPSDGTGVEELLVETDLPKIPASWSPDGKFIVYWNYDPKTGADQWLLPTTGDRKPVPLLNSPFGEHHSQISPDGKLIAYMSTQTGQSEVYVKPFPSGNGRWQVSTNGGVLPRWRGDGKEIFYFTAYNLGKVMAVAVTLAGSTFQAGVPRELFDAGGGNFAHPSAAGGFHNYAVSRDGQRFLIPRPASNLQGEANSAPITVVLNWPALLRN